MIKVDILTMKLSDNREEYYVRITCDGRTHDTNRYSQRYYNRALYERDCLRHTLLGDPKPRLSDSLYDDLED